MLVMPNSPVPQTLRDTAVIKEMGEVITLYGKPKLMISLTREGQLDFAKAGERDGRLGRRRIREGTFLPLKYTK